MVAGENSVYRFDNGSETYIKLQFVKLHDIYSPPRTLISSISYQTYRLNKDGKIKKNRLAA